MSWRKPSEWTVRRRRLVMAAALWPLVYTVVLLALPPARLWFVSRGWRMPAGGPSSSEWVGLLAHAATLVETGVTLVLCALHLASTPRLPEPQRLPWLLLMLLAAPVALPVYACLWVLPDDPTVRLRPPRPPAPTRD